MSVNMLKGLHRRVLGITPRDKIQAPYGAVSGGDGKPAIVWPNHDTVSVWEDFTGPGNQAADTGIPIYTGHFRRLAGDTGHHAAFVAGTNGVFRLFSTPSVGAAKTAAAGQAIGSALQWKGNAGPDNRNGFLRFGARLKLETVGRTTKRLHVFAGFTDIATYEFPCFDTGAGVQTAADDFVGFMFSPGGDTGWSAVSGRATADQVLALGVGPATNTYDTIEVEITRGTSDTGGSATFYVNGKAVGRIDSPVTSSVALNPVIYAFQQDTGMEFLDIDCVHVSSTRDTGL
jgi:hypothetical protein